MVCLSTRCLCHDLQAYCNAGSICRSVLSCKLSTSEFVMASGSPHIFFSSVRLMSSRRPIKISGWWLGGDTQNLSLTHRVGSTMKSGKDLWNGRTGELMSSWRIRREWTDDSRRNTLSGSKPNRTAIVDGERGFAASMTAPRIERTFGSSSGSSPPKAS